MPAPLQELLADTRVKEFPIGQILVYAGDEVSDVFVLKSGYVKIYDIDDDGNEKILHIVDSPSLVPLAFFSGSHPVTRWFYSALTDCEVYVLPATVLFEAMSNSGPLSVALMNEFSNDVHELLTRLSSLGKTKAVDKVIATLKFLVTCMAIEQKPGWWRVPFIINHQLLADINGITRESTAGVMKDLQNKKIIRNPKLNVLEINKERLLKYK